MRIPLFLSGIINFEWKNLIYYFNFRCLNIVSIIKMKHHWLDFLHHRSDDKNSQTNY